MTASLISSNTFAFADGNAGHVIDLGSALSSGQEDVLCVNSNTTVSTPAGFAAAPTNVGGQGAYIFRRQDSGTSTVTITTAGDHNTSVIWSRWGSIVAADDAAKTTATGDGTSTPAHSTNPLAATNELSIAFAALHNFSGANPTAPSWSAGYTPLLSNAQGTGGTGVVGFVAYKLTAGTAAETPSVSWTNNAFDRYMFTLTFTTSSAISGALGTATETDTAGSLGRRKARTLGVAATTDTAQAFTRVKTRTLGVAAETASAGTVGRVKARTLGVAADTSTAGTFGRSRAYSFGTAVEVDAAGNLGKKLGLNTAVELDSARPITRATAVAAVPATQRAKVTRGPQRAAATRAPQRAKVVRGS